MNKDSETLTDQREALKLKLPELEVSYEKPWRDDVLNREEIASRLTDIVRNQSLPFVISIHGEWGTGNTFNKTRRVNLRVTERDFLLAHSRAREEGMPYQTLLSSVIHKYLSGRLTEKR